MEYYQIKQREDLRRVPKLLNVFGTVDKRDLIPERMQRVPEVLFYKTEAPEHAQYPDIIDRDLFLITPALMQAFKIYEPDLPYILTVLSDMKHEDYTNYHMPVFEEVECLSEQTEYNMDKSVIKKLVLDEGKTGGRALFRIKHGIQPIIVARLDAAESILRRDFIGIALERLLVEQKRTEGAK